MYVCMVVTYNRVWINRVRSTSILLTGKMKIFLSPFAPENLISRDGVRPSRPASARSFSILRLNLVLTHGIPPDFRGGIHLFKPSYEIESVPTLSGHAIAYP